MKGTTRYDCTIDFFKWRVRLKYNGSTVEYGNSHVEVLSIYSKV